MSSNHVRFTRDIIHTLNRIPAEMIVLVCVIPVLLTPVFFILREQAAQREVDATEISNIEYLQLVPVAHDSSPELASHIYEATKDGKISVSENRQIMERYKSSLKMAKILAALPKVAAPGDKPTLNPQEAFERVKSRLVNLQEAEISTAEYMRVAGYTTDQNLIQSIREAMTDGKITRAEYADIVGRMDGPNYVMSEGTNHASND